MSIKKYSGFIIRDIIMLLGFFLLALVDWRISVGVALILVACKELPKIFSGDMK